MFTRLLRIVSALLITASGTALPDTASAARGNCTTPPTVRELNNSFATRSTGILGADYQRTIALPDGRVLWLLQDAFLAQANGTTTLVHNVGLVQRGSCFTLLRQGSSGRPTPWVGAASTTPRNHWFWLLGGAIGTDGQLRVFAAEFRETGRHYLEHAQPVATWLATIDVTTLRVTDFRPAADSTPALYGWAVASDSSFTYLFAHCYRQFGFGWLGHDSCAANVQVGRVRLGDLAAAPLYWNGSTWGADPSAAANIAPAIGPSGEVRAINPIQVAFVRGTWIAVTKEGDWWGTKIYLDRAPTPIGPWTTSSVFEAEPLGNPDTFDTYFASFVSIGERSAVLGLSNNRWDGRLSRAYRPTFRIVPLDRWFCAQTITC